MKETDGRIRGLIAFGAWPAVAGIWEARRLLRGYPPFLFVILCAFAGAVFMPSQESDGGFMVQEMMRVSQWGMARAGEPLSFGMAAVIARAHLPAGTYFLYVGTLYGLFVAAVIRMVQRVAAEATANRQWPGIAFAVAAFANHPVMAALNARYYLALWMVVYCVMALAIEGRTPAAAVGAAAAVLSHSGTLMVVGVVLGWAFTLSLGRRQIWVAYGALAFAFAVPPGTFVQIGQDLSSSISFDAFQQVASNNLSRVRPDLVGGSDASAGGGAWFLQWFQQPMFWALLASGHLLLWRYGATWDDVSVRLWAAVIMMWALKVALRGFIGIDGRAQTVAAMLLLLWHALWFLRRPQGALLAISITALPLSFYFIVSYRRWLDDASTTLLLPTPFALAGEMLPRISGLIFW